MQLSGRGWVGDCSGWSEDWVLWMFIKKTLPTLPPLPLLCVAMSVGVSGRSVGRSLTLYVELEFEYFLLIRAPVLKSKQTQHDWFTTYDVIFKDWLAKRGSKRFMAVAWIWISLNSFFTHRKFQKNVLSRQEKSFLSTPLIMTALLMA